MYVLYICIYIYIYMYVYICMYYIYTYTYTYTYIYIYIYIYIYTESGCYHLDKCCSCDAQSPPLTFLLNSDLAMQ